MSISAAELPQVLDLAQADSVRFHLSLNVADLARSVAFFRTFFGLEPAKQRGDYAKFELAEPPLVLSLEPFKASPGGNLNHLGFRLPSMEALVDYQRRLEMAGIATQREEGVECCYAKQTKFWVHDPDGNLWEIYTFDGDLDHRGTGQVPEKVLGTNRPPPAESPAADSASSGKRATAIWAHRLGEHFPVPLPIQDGTVDEALLQGTINAALSDDQTNAVLAEVWRALKPGGQVLLHVLTADRSLAGVTLSLPGPAAAVQQVPATGDLLQIMATAGFVNIELTKFGESPCFVSNGVEMRETKILAHKPSPGTTVRKLLYKGPFRELTDDAGRSFTRGQWSDVDELTWLQLKAGPASDSFLFGI